jgi:ureidoacrylate peracid hydrolase
MAERKFDREFTALLVIDPYNDFISEGGKVWDRLRGVAEANGCVPNMPQVLNAARGCPSRRRYCLLSVTESSDGHRAHGAEYR